MILRCLTALFPAELVWAVKKVRRTEVSRGLAMMVGNLRSGRLKNKSVLYHRKAISSNNNHVQWSQIMPS